LKVNPNKFYKNKLEKIYIENCSRSNMKLL